MSVYDRHVAFGKEMYLLAEQRKKLISDLHCLKCQRTPRRIKRRKYAPNDVAADAGTYFELLFLKRSEKDESHKTFPNQFKYEMENVMLTEDRTIGDKWKFAYVDLERHEPLIVPLVLSPGPTLTRDDVIMIANLNGRIVAWMTRMLQYCVSVKHPRERVTRLLRERNRMLKITNEFMHNILPR